MVVPIDAADAPLSAVTFVILDLETTGGSPWSCGITEVGAVKLRGGECLGTFQTLVNPGVPIPPEVTYLTGITTSLVGPAPLIDAVLPALLEFVGGAVIVGHNARFDISFLGAAADRLGYPRPANRVIDTCTLARRLVADEVPDCKLSTLSAFFRTPRRPTHRALDDAVATGEVLHSLLERAGSFGVLALDDLVQFPSVRRRGALAKLKITNRLPRQPGVYVFRDACGGPLFVGAAPNLRRHVRAYFAEECDDRRRARQLTRQVCSVDHVACSNDLEAEVQAVRLIHQLAPRFNPETGRRPAYVRLTPRLAVTRQARPGDGCAYLGPLPSVGVARLVAAAIAAVISLCPGAEQRLGSASAGQPSMLLDPLAGKMAALAAAHRYEEAGAVRDQGAALANALHLQGQFDTLRRAATVVVEAPGEGGAILHHGRLVATWRPGEPVPATPLVGDAITDPLSLEMADELAVVARWFDERRDGLQVLDAGAALYWPAPRLSPFDSRPPSWWSDDRGGVAGCRWDAVA